MKTEKLSDAITIINADCYTLLDSWPSDAAIVTDPPYGISYSRSQDMRMRQILPGRTPMAFGRSAGDWRQIHGDDKPFDPTPFLRFATVCLWGANHYASKLPDKKGWLVWDKLAGKTPSFQSDCELAWTNKDAPARLFTHLWRGIMREGEEHIMIGGPKLHPNQKPVALLAWCLDMCCIHNGLVIDPFMGSGSMGVACHRAGLQYIGVEIDEQHYQTARQRLLNELAQTNLFRQDEDARAGQGECPGTACNSGRDAMPLDIFEGVQ